MLNFIRFAQDHRVPFITGGHHHCVRGWLQTHCPSCTDAGHGYHLGFNLSKGYFNCWRCGRLRHIDVIRALAKVSKEHAYRILGKYDDARPETKGKALARQRKVKAPPYAKPLTHPLMAGVGKHWEYLRSRDITPEQAELWDLHGTHHLSGRWQWRIVFPVRNEEAQIIGWIGRALGQDTKPKYRVTEDEKCLEDPKGWVYGIDKAQEDYVLVVEGGPDVWRMGPGAVGTLGIDWNIIQANKLRRFKRRFIIFDPDEQAQKQAQKLAEWLSYFPGETEIITGLKTDPGDMLRKDVKRLREELKV